MVDNEKLRYSLFAFVTCVEPLHKNNIEFNIIDLYCLVYYCDVSQWITLVESKRTSLLVI